MDESNNIDNGAPGNPPKPENPFAAHSGQPESPLPVDAAAAAPSAPQPSPQVGAVPQASGAANAAAPAPATPAPQAAASQTAPQAAAPQQVPQAQGAQQAYQSYQPYAQAPASSYAPYDQTYGSYGAAGQPPVPPTTSAPVYGYEPAAPAGGQKRRWPWFLLGLAVGLVIGMGGCVSCVGVMAATSASSYGNHADPTDSWDYNYNYDYDDSRGNGGDSDTVPQMPSSPDSAAAGTYTVDEIAKTLFPDGAPADAPADGSVCKAGVYTVGATGQIPAGLYYLQGTEDAESHYYVFEAADDAPGRYKMDDSVVYFGNYFVELDEGDLIVFKPAGDQTMYPAPATSIEPKAPYNDGCYRVGIDIPAGSYTITSYAPSAAATENECGAFVMKDLDFDEDSIVESAYVIPGGKQVITVTDGQYLELFAATATPVTQG